MNNWLAVTIIIVVFLIIMGNFNTLYKNSKQPLRKKKLNDLKETLPRTKKISHKMPNKPKHK